MKDTTEAISPKTTAPAHGRRLLGLLAVIGFALLILGVVVIVSLAVAYETRYADRVYLGVIVAGLDVGGLTPSEVEALVADQPGPWENTRLPLHFGERVWEPTLAELGMESDAQATAVAAYAIGREVNASTGRSMDLGARLRRHLQLLRLPETVAVTKRFNEGVATAYLTALAAEIDRPPRDATLTLNDLQVRSTPGHYGRQLDVAASLARMRQAVAQPHLEPVDLVVRQVSPLVEETSEAAARLERVISAPVTLTYGQQEWIVDRTTLADLVVIGQEPNGDGRARFVVSLDPKGLASVVGPLAAEINQLPRDAVLDFDAVADQLVIVAPSQEGRTLDVDESVRRVLAQVTAPGPTATTERTVPLAVTVQQPIVDEHSVPNMGIVELVASATSYFYGSSAGRVNNIRLAASKFDRVLIPPGTIFSFNEHLGPVTAEEGYDETLIIADNRTSRGVGGGVCQISTTAFRAAFWGGFPIIERWPHGYRVGYYEQGGNPPGLDATIYTPSIDFKFENDTLHWLLVKTYFDAANSAVTFRFYGTKPDRVVELEGPVVENVVEPAAPVEEEDPELPAGTRQRIELAREGADVTLYRIIKQGDVVLRWERFFSRYAATEERWKVGTGG